MINYPSKSYKLKTVKNPILSIFPNFLYCSTDSGYYMGTLSDQIMNFDSLGLLKIVNYLEHLDKVPEMRKIARMIQ